MVTMNSSQVVQATYENGVLRPVHPLELAERQVVQIRLDTETATEHPYVTQTPGVCGGRPIVRGTRIPVKALAGYHRMGYTLTEILEGFSGLTAAQLHSALSYYYDHQAEIDADIEADELSALLDRFQLKMDAEGVLRPIE
jgi:uncharacterized protein (DUF433 family)